MNKFTTISTKEYAPLSYKEEYFHNKYEIIRSFLQKEFGEKSSNILAFPQIKNREVDWHSKYNTRLKRVTEFSKVEQEKILNIYWEEINKIKVLSSSFENSNSKEKKRWANLLDDVFNSNNNIVFSDGENIVLLWGWKFNALAENYISPPIISTANENPPVNISKPIEEDNPIPIIPLDPIDDDPIVPEIPWYILLWEWIKKFWWILLLLLLLLWFLLNLDSCKAEVIVDPIPQDTISNDPKNQPKNWDPDNNNTGLPEEEYRQVIENNLPPELYENLLTDENGDPRILPNKEQVHIPFNPDDLIEEENTHQMIISDRVNVYLKNSDDKIEDFAKKFKEKFPSSDYQIIYKDDKLRRIQIRVPETERVTIKDEIKEKLPNYKLLIWDETIFQGGSFNDPDLKNNTRNYYFRNINMFDAWKITTGKKDIIIAVIDDGFDLNHDELNDNIVSPYNVLYQNNKVYANSELAHGTHVAGLAISEKNNAKGVCGIAPDCSFMPIQMSNKGGLFTSSAIIDGILHAINNGADVINLSIQIMHPEEAKQVTQKQLNQMLNNISRDDELFWNELFEIANDSNITIVFSAGNCEVLIGLDAMKRYDNIITVSATDIKNNKADFSNYGIKSTISAPGVDIWSCKPGGGFVMQDGTSMSSPIIAGVVGLMKSINPNLTNKEIINILKTSGKSVDPTIGPLVQVDKALELCGGQKITEIRKGLNTDSIKNEIKELEKKIEKLKKLM